MNFLKIINFYRGTMIKAENFEGFKEDNEVMKRWPLRAWTDSAYRLFLIRSTRYYFFQLKLRFSEKATKI